MVRLMLPDGVVVEVAKHADPRRFEGEDEVGPGSPGVASRRFGLVDAVWTGSVSPGGVGSVTSDTEAVAD